MLEGDPKVLVACGSTLAVAVPVTGGGTVAGLDKFPWHAVREAAKDSNRKKFFLVKNSIIFICRKLSLPKSR